MKRIPILSVIHLLLFIPFCSAQGSDVFDQGSVFVTGQIGLTSMVKSVDFGSDPFNENPFPLGGGIEVMLTDRIGAGGSVIYDRWNDLFGVWGGIWSVTLVKPSFDFTCHIRTDRIEEVDFLTGAQIGYSFVDIINKSIPSAQYFGNLGNEIHFAPFVGINLHFPNAPRNFFERLSLTVKVVWSVTGDYSGVYGIIGPTFQIR